MALSVSHLPETDLSRRDAILFGLGTAASATFSTSALAGDSNHIRMIVGGVVGGETATFLFDTVSGQVSRSFETPSPQAAPSIQQVKIPAGMLFLDQSVSGDLLVQDVRDEHAKLCVLSSSGQLKYEIPAYGSLPDAKFSSTGREIAFVEFDAPMTRLVLVRACGRGRRVLNEVNENGSMRGVSWSPCNSFLGVVAYDWGQFGEAEGYPVPDSHRIDLFDISRAGTRKSTPVSRATWLDRVEWTVG